MLFFLLHMLSHVSHTSIMSSNYYHTLLFYRILHVALIFLPGCSGVNPIPALSAPRSNSSRAIWKCSFWDASEKRHRSTNTTFTNYIILHLQPITSSSCVGAEVAVAHVVAIICNTRLLKCTNKTSGFEPWHEMQVLTFFSDWAGDVLVSVSSVFRVFHWGGQDMSKTSVRRRMALWSRPPNNSSSSKCSVPISSLWRKKRTISKWPSSTANRTGVIPALLIMWLAPLSTRSRTVSKSPATQVLRSKSCGKQRNYWAKCSSGQLWG